MAARNEIQKKNGLPDAAILGDMALAIQRKEVSLEGFAPELQEVLKNYDVRELVGIAPSWKPKEIGEYIVGQCVSARDNVGQYKSTVVTIESPNGPVSVWLSADLQVKFGGHLERMLDKNYVVRFEGWANKASNWLPLSRATSDKDMKVFRVLEIGNPKLPIVQK